MQERAALTTDDAVQCSPGWVTPAHSDQWLRRSVRTLVDAQRNSGLLWSHLAQAGSLHNNHHKVKSMTIETGSACWG